MKIFYLNRINKFEREHSSLLHRRNIIGLLRLLIFILGIVLSVYLYGISGFFSIIAIIFFTIIFLYLIKLDLKNQDEINFLETLIEVNKNELNILDKGENIYSNGNQFKDSKHQYSSDLDLFGKASLYQFLNRTNTNYGNKILANWLLNKANINEIKERQESINELSNLIDWRQQLQAHGLINNKHNNNIFSIENWLQEPIQFCDRKWLKLFIKISPLMLISSIVASFFFLNIIFPILLFLIHVFIIFSTYKKVDILYKQTSKRSEILKTYAKMIKHIEKTKFSTKKILDLQSSFQHENYRASAELKALSKIIKYLDYRLNLFYLPLNLCFFWDLHWLIKTEKFKQKNKNHIQDWFKSMGEFEILISLANLSFNNPNWITPTITEEKGIFLAEEIGHPLINESFRVSNSININAQPLIFLITGSNMAGKSTFLRTIGINIVLALSGSNVCARSLHLSTFDLYSSMRVFDSLEQNTSSFYAELQRLRLVIEAVDKGNNVLFLLDEILKGTNSQDRHIGSKALINQLLNNNGTGLIATHDLELGYLEEITRGKVVNYNFDVQIQNEELYFDYILRKGICRSLNASILMRKIGINL